MKLKVELFCALATSISWQTWLYHFDAEIYRSFITKLYKARGCGENKIVMIDILEEIQKIGGDEQLLRFLNENYPHVINNEAKAGIDKHGVFPGYNENIVTYPHRKIFTDKKEADKLISKKGRYDYIIVGDLIYVEYLERSEDHLFDKIPDKNWQIAAYRKNKL